MFVSVAVLGAGINGLACAVKIKEKYPDYKVVLISDEFSPNTTGDGAGGYWHPYLCGTTAEDRLIKWGMETYDYLHQLWLEGGHDVCLMPCYNMYRNKENISVPGWAHLVFGYRSLDGLLLKYLNWLFSGDYVKKLARRSGCIRIKLANCCLGAPRVEVKGGDLCPAVGHDRAGHTFSTFVYTPSTTLNQLMNRFKSMNGEIMQAKIESLQDTLLAGFDVVINCIGVSARSVVPDDRVHPIRGQIAKVHAPWLNETILDIERGHYIIPNVHMCIMGGTSQTHNYNRTVDDKDTAFIFNGCHNLVPSLKHAKILDHWVGLRPGRDEVRLEPEWRNGKLFIHNYGHGGSGLTLFWGCATEVLQLLNNNLNQRYLCKL